MGVSGFGRPGAMEQSGMTKRVRFSYRAISRSSFAGVFPSVCARLYVVSVDRSYAATAFESRCLIWNTYMGMPLVQITSTCVAELRVGTFGSESTIPFITTPGIPRILYQSHMVSNAILI